MPHTGPELRIRSPHEIMINARALPCIIIKCMLFYLDAACDRLSVPFHLHAIGCVLSCVYFMCRKAVCPYPHLPDSQVRSLFCYMRLNGGQSAEHAGVSVPLRLLRLLLKHATELKSEFADGFARTPSVVWRGSVPQLFARLAHPDLIVRQHVQTLLCSIGQHLPELVLYPALVGSEDPTGPSAAGCIGIGGSTAATPPNAPQQAAMSEMQAIRRALQVRIA